MGTCAGTSTTIADVEAKATMLGDLIPRSRAIRCGWQRREGTVEDISEVLNPGSHDDDVPSTTDGPESGFRNLRKIAKNHHKHWPGGL